MGHNFVFGSGPVMEPQVQPAQRNVSFDDASDAYGRFNTSGGESLRGRVGIRLGDDWNLGDERKPHLLTTWLRTNPWHEFRGDNPVTEAAFDGTPLRYIP